MKARSALIGPVVVATALMLAGRGGSDVASDEASALPADSEGQAAASEPEGDADTTGDSDDESASATNLCTALPLDDVTQLFNDAFGELLMPMEIVTDTADECSLREESVDEGEVWLHPSTWNASDIENCNEDDVVEGVGELACWSITRNADQYGVDFMLAESIYRMDVANHDFDDLVVEAVRSDPAMELVTQMAALAAGNLE